MKITQRDSKGHLLKPEASTRTTESTKLGLLKAYLYVHYNFNKEGNKRKKTAQKAWEQSRQVVNPQCHKGQALNSTYTTARHLLQGKRTKEW